MNAERQMCLLKDMGTHQDIDNIIRKWIPNNFKFAGPLSQAKAGPGMLYPSNSGNFQELLEYLFPGIPKTACQYIEEGLCEIMCYYIIEKTNIKDYRNFINGMDDSDILPMIRVFDSYEDIIDFINDDSKIHKKYWERLLPRFESISFYSPHSSSKSRIFDIDFDDIVKVYGQQFGVPLYIKLYDMYTKTSSLHANIMLIDTALKKVVRIDPNGKLGTGTCDEVTQTYAYMSESL